MKTILRPFRPLLRAPRGCRGIFNLAWCCAFCSWSITWASSIISPDSPSPVYSLSPKTLGVLKSLDSPSRFTRSWTRAPRRRRPASKCHLLKEYQRVGKDIDVKDRSNFDITRDGAAKEASLRRQRRVIIFEYKDTRRFVKERICTTSTDDPETGAFKGDKTDTAALMSCGSKNARLLHRGPWGTLGAGLTSPRVRHLRANLRTTISRRATSISPAGEVPRTRPVVIGSRSPSRRSKSRAWKILANNGKLIVLLDLMSCRRTTCSRSMAEI